MQQNRFFHDLCSAQNALWSAGTETFDVFANRASRNFVNLDSDLHVQILLSAQPGLADSTLQTILRHSYLGLAATQGQSE